MAGYRTTVIIGYLFIGISYVVLILSMLLSCRPGYKMWQIYPDPGSKSVEPNEAHLAPYLAVRTLTYYTTRPLPAGRLESVHIHGHDPEYIH